MFLKRKLKIFKKMFKTFSKNRPERQGKSINKSVKINNVWQEERQHLI